MQVLLLLFCEEAEKSQVHWKKGLVRKKANINAIKAILVSVCGTDSNTACHTVVSIVSITSSSHCEGDRRGHSSGSQLLSGL